MNLQILNVIYGDRGGVFTGVVVEDKDELWGEMGYFEYEGNFGDEFGLIIFVAGKDEFL